MPLNESLQKQLRKHYEASAIINTSYKGNDLVIKTDSDGNAVTVFIGKKSGDRIRGQRYARTLKKNDQGEVIKDHWDLKGKAS
ncbi:MAG TPA: hypothetical protein VD884_01440 [Ohtaekwangia sp.]|nr:hypothetical protein [Ohtaekwangia sp.]